MISNETQNVQEPHVDSQSSMLAIQSALRFLGAIRYRKNVLIVALFGTCLLGAIYFFTATRYYAAKAGMMVIQSGVDEQGNNLTNNTAALRSQMNIYQRVICSPKVLNSALSKLNAADRIDLEEVDKEFWGMVLQKKLKVSVPQDTNILDISYQSKDPQVAVNVVNAITDAFLDFIDQTKKGTAAEISRVLTNERNEVSKKLEEKQKELIDARHKFGEFGTNAQGESLNPVIKRAIFYNDQLNDIQKQRIKLQASLASIQSAIRNGEDLQQHLISLNDTVGKEMLMESFGLSYKDRYTRSELEKSLVLARTELDAMQGRYGPAHPKMVQQLQKIRELEDYLGGMQTRSAEGMDRLQESQLRPMLVQMVQQRLGETLKEEETLIQLADSSRNEAIGLSGELTALRMLEHDINRLRETSDVLIKQIASINLQNGGQEVQAAVIEQPIVIKQPVSPKLRQVAGISIIAGLFLGLLAIYILDELDDRFRTIEDIERQLHVPVMAIIRRLLVHEGVGADAIQVHVAPNVTESEAFRTLRTSLTLQGQNLQRLIVTSPEPGDGKTTISSNISACFAQAGKRVLMLDADMRRPGLTRMMGLQGQEGMSDLLRETRPIREMAEEFIIPSGIEGFDLISSGPRPSNPSELLSNHRMSELLDWASAHYDLVVIDSPPILAASDCAILGNLVDGIALVIRPDKSRRRTIQRAVDFLTSLKMPLLGLVLNNLAAGDQGGGYSHYGYGYGYGYGYSYDYHYGGEDQEFDEEPSEIREASPKPKPTVPRRVA